MLQTLSYAYTCVISFYSSPQHYEVGTVTIPILEKGKQFEWVNSLLSKAGSR